MDAPPAGPAPAPVPASVPAPAASPSPAAIDGPLLPEALVDAPLLAAGLLDTLGRRRRAALWRTVTDADDGAEAEEGADGREGTGAAAADTGRPGAPSPTVSRGVGDDPPVPSGPAAAAHDALRVGADPASVRFLDRALCALADVLTTRGGRSPVVYAAWLTGQELHLQFAEDAEQPPPPWRFGQSAQFWSIRRTDLDGPGPEGSGTGTAPDAAAGAAPVSVPAGEANDSSPGSGAPAPYPGLVSLGTRGDARLLLNLESVPGLVSVAGTPEQRTGVLAAVAAELATSVRASTTDLTLVGFGAELAALASDRVRHVADVPLLLHAMETGTADAAPGARGPHLVLVGAEPTDDEAERLASLAADESRRCGFVVGHEAGRIPGAVWEFTAEDGVLAAPPLGLELRARPLTREVRTSVVELFTATDADGDPTEGRGPGFRADLSDGGRPDVYARLLGPYEILGLAEPEATCSALLHEALALLLLHREGLHPRVLVAALRHHGVGDDGGRTLLDRLGVWLGTEPDGTPRLGADRTGRLVLRPSVVSDWDVLRTLHHGTTGERGARLTPPVRRHQLVGAMELARGPLLADRAPAPDEDAEGAYGWLAHEPDLTRHPLLVAEVGLALSAAHLRLGEAPRAEDAVRAALRSAPTDPRLWTELSRTAHTPGTSEGATR